MRICKYCETEMVEGNSLKVTNASILAGIVVANRHYSEKPKVAICPQCGELSIYITNLSWLGK